MNIIVNNIEKKQGEQENSFYISAGIYIMQNTMVGGGWVGVWPLGKKMKKEDLVGKK